MKTIVLSVKDRFLLLHLLPQQGGRIQMMVVRAIYDQVTFSAEDVAGFELKDLPGGGLHGNPPKFTDKEVYLTAEQVNILKDIPARLEAEQKVTIDLLPLLDKIDLL